MNRFMGFAAALVFGILPWTAGKSLAQDTIVVGAAIGESGWIAPYDGPPLNAAKLAIDEINQQGGLLGKQLELIVADTKTDRAQGAKAAAEVIDKGAQFLITSCDYDMGGPGALVAQERGVIVFSPCAGDSKFGPKGIGDLAFTMASSTGNQAYVSAEWAHSRKGWRKAYLLLDNTNEFHKSSVRDFEEAWNRLPDAEVVGKDLFKNDDPSIASQITRIKNLAEAPDFIFIASHTPGGPSAMRQMRAAGIDSAFLGVGDMDGDYWLGAVPDLSNFYFSTYNSVFGDDPNPDVNAFVEKFAAMFGSRPGGSFALTGYSVIEAWAKAVRAAGTTDSGEVRDALEAFDNEPLLVGATSFNSEKHIQYNRPMVIMQVQNGKMSAVESFVNEMTASN